MSPTSIIVGSKITVEAPDLQQLIDSLIQRGFSVAGPRIRAGAVVYDTVTKLSDLPSGWSDEQESGTYRLQQSTEGLFFNYTVGPHCWKKFLSPPKARFWAGERTGGSFKPLEQEHRIPRQAILGVRPCELQAIAVQDKVYTQGPYVDIDYQSRRAGLFVVAVNCTRAGGTCFCASMGTGPKASTGFDLALTELHADGRHRFLVEVGSPAGAEALVEMRFQDAGPAEIQASESLLDEAAKNMGRSMSTDNLRELLYRNCESPRWDEVATRCLTCANCTMVCPTCFCCSIEDATDLAGKTAERWRRWDSCFAVDFSYIHGGSVRQSAKARYRQWITHKLAAWIDQFGTSGCVGCGRCITWCPVAIDITKEVQALRDLEIAGPATEPEEENNYANP